jgi:hypothetical protein
LRQSQQAALQQERPRALGQMASGIAHDINNALSPVALYTESLLEHEPGLSPAARERLETVQRAIEDVAQTVSRMREFYRLHEPQLTLSAIDLNGLAGQVMELTRARWSDMPQQRGCVIELRTELAPRLPAVMGVESEIREALINLVFNAVDAMPDGGTLTLRTRGHRADSRDGRSAPVLGRRNAGRGFGRREVRATWAWRGACGRGRPHSGHAHFGGGVRHGRGHGRRDPPALPGAVLHHQRRARHGPRLGDGVRDGAAPQLGDRNRERPWQGHHRAAALSGFHRRAGSRHGRTQFCAARAAAAPSADR